MFLVPRNNFSRCSTRSCIGRLTDFDSHANDCGDGDSVGQDASLDVGNDDNDWGLDHLHYTTVDCAIGGLRTEMLLQA